MIRWEVPGPYVVGFTTRAGGVSEGLFASLNLGGTEDWPEAVGENRKRACQELGLDPSQLAFNRQRHTAVVHRARRGLQETDGDALVTHEAGLPLLATSADCVPIAIAATNGRPALAVVHAGWRGLSAGVVEATVAGLGGGAMTAVIGPSIGPCCYEVGTEVSERFDPDLTRGRVLDLPEAAERALHTAGVARVDRVDLCTCCNAELFFSHRRDGALHGVQGVIGAIAG